MTPLTGNDVARLFETAERARIDHGAVAVLPVTHWVDSTARKVYLDGRLPLDEYFAALAAGLAELTTERSGGGADNVIPMRTRENFEQRRRTS